jgi:RNA polymerase sigma factor (sigma-70 family)
VEASALHAPSLNRVPLGTPLLRLRSDEQLLALFRAGSEEAFGAIHDRYRQRLFAYVRQMLSKGPRQDAEDVMQDVFVRAYGALRADEREVNLRAWLYRVAHNRCIDHLRRPTPPPAEIFEMSRKPLHDPIVEAQRREDLTRLVEDVGRLPEQQRSALLMREIDGMSYADLASALDVTIPAVKSLLVRARVGLVAAAAARDADCCDIRDDLLASYDRGVKASGRARKHMRSCAGCREYREALRGMRRSFAALTPVSAGLFGSVAASLGIGGGGAAAGGAAAGGGGVAATAAGGTLATATACKVAAVVCTAALTAGGAVEVQHLKRDKPVTAKAAALAPVSAAAAAEPVPVRDQPVVHRTMSQPVTPAPQKAPAAKTKATAERRTAVSPVATGLPVPAKAETPVTTAPDTTAPARTGGVTAPEQAPVTQSPSAPTDSGSTSTPTTGSPQQGGTVAPGAGTPSGSGSGSGSTGTGAQSGSGGDPSAPPSEH